MNTRSEITSRTAARELRVLLVEDSPMDALLLEHALARGGFRPVCRRVDTSDAMAEALDSQEWDVILADHAMPCFSAPAALELAKQRGLDIPFIIVSGHIEETTAVAAMRAGAHDYIMKDRLARLAPAVERELREAAMRREQKRCELELRRAHDELEMRVEKRTADLRAANLKLQQVIEERRRLENELLDIAENERRSIGFDLHDDLGQKLTGVSLMLKGLEQRLAHEGHPYVEEARRIRELVEQIVHHTHNLAHEFSALGATGDDLETMLKGLVDNVEKMFGIPCGLALKGDLSDLPPNTIVQFCKISQEAISNAVKHGKARRVSISLCQSGDKCTLTIKNAGIPFSVPPEKKNRMGLRIMNYRANTVGATLDIRPNGKNGTVVTCVLPAKNGGATARGARNGKPASHTRGRSRVEMAMA
ncbi:MAG TPA: response regulator [Verrucomicrobiota bacterium]|nr:response regulator [Verrucomicrobiota bacterium]